MIFDVLKSLIFVIRPELYTQHTQIVIFTDKYDVIHYRLTALK